MRWNCWPALVGLLLLCGAAARDDLEIDVREPTVTRRDFDPANPPEDLPPMNRGEKAWCSYNYKIATNFRYSVRKIGSRQAEVQVRSITVTTDLAITLWLPHGAPRKLVAHEQGHQRICEMIYADAESIARAAAEPYLGRRVRVKGRDVDEAAREAIDDLMDELKNEYLKHTSGVTGRVQDTYDELTDHGRKLRPTEDEAIEKAFEKEAERSEE
jgi:hypothetical protein